MNTKSFVNQLDADHVVKGYYDESDQLVMVEPEGSGGGGDSDFTTAKFTVSGFGDTPPAGSMFTDGLIVIDSETDELFAIKALPDGIYDILLYKGSQNCTITNPFLGDDVTITGNYADGIITGDVTITLENK